MKPDRLADGVYRVAAKIGNRDLFEGIWPIPDGVMLNSYVIKGSNKSVLIDMVKDWDGALAAVDQQLESLSLEKGKLDYIVINHMEPDHTGSMAKIVEKYPDVQILCSDKAVNLIKHFYKIEKNVHAVKDGETLDLGGKTLQFFMTPNIHWPETMMTYDKVTKTLFSCDAFGGFGCLEGGIFDDEVDMSYYEGEILRYFSNIVGRYSDQVQAAISKLSGVEVKVVAPSHGPIHRSKPEHIIGIYDKWSRHETECGAVVVYGSMYGNTAKLAHATARALAKEGIGHVIVHDIARDHVSFVIRDIWRYRGLVLASCTYNTMPFPPIQDLMTHLENKKMKNRLLGIMGNYTWSPGILKKLKEFAQSAGKWELLSPEIVIQSSPKDEDYDKAVQLGKNMAQKLKECQ